MRRKPKATRHDGAHRTCTEEGSTPRRRKRKKIATPLTVTFTATNHGGNNIYKKKLTCVQSAPKSAAPPSTTRPAPTVVTVPNTLNPGAALRGRDLPGSASGLPSSRGPIAASTSNGARSRSSMSTQAPPAAARVSAPGRQANSPGTSVQACAPRRDLLSVWSSRWSSRRGWDDASVSLSSSLPVVLVLIGAGGREGRERGEGTREKMGEVFSME